MRKRRNLKSPDELSSSPLPWDGDFYDLFGDGNAFSYEPPKQGKKIEVVPLAKLPRGDNGADMEPGSVSASEAAIKAQQEQINLLMQQNAELIKLLKPQGNATIPPPTVECQNDPN